MNLGRAIAIFENIQNDGDSLEVKGFAIRKVLDMETHNSIKKQSMLNVIDWMWNQMFEIEQEDEDDGKQEGEE